jgi:LmbE family N-acetylglucosaminyl deacetylase
MRHLSALLYDWSVACARLANPPVVHERTTPAAKARARARAKAGWSAILERLAEPNVVARLLASGLIGDDLPRASGLPRGRRILVLAAHQDDETIGAGGTFLLCARAGCEFSVVYYTDGATGLGGARPAEVSRWRRDEAVRVWQRIAGITPTFWNYPNRATSMAPDAGARLAGVIEEFKPDTIFLPTFFEQPVEHRRLNEVLLAAAAIRPIGKDVEIWGYQVTTRVSGNRSVDITAVWKRKYAVNRLWATQNAYLDYAHLAMGRDIANTYYLKATGAARRAAAHAELFVALDAPDYLELASLCVPLHQPGDRGARGPAFFVVGMQKSGSYWVTALLNGHPEIRCFPSRPKGRDGAPEAHFFDVLARLDEDFEAFRSSMRKKLGGAFADLVPDTPPATRTERDDLVDRLRTRFNEYCSRQGVNAGKRLVGEKTTETVHYPDLVRSLYPGVRKVCILRDPRDRVVSFFFHQQRKRQLGANALLSDDYVRRYVERVQRDYRGLLEMEGPLFVVTYEQLSADPEQYVRRLLEFLGVDASDRVVSSLIRAASFEALSGRAPGTSDPTSHFRQGTPGAWSDHLPAAMADFMTTALDSLTRQVEDRFGLDLSGYRASSRIS